MKTRERVHNLLEARTLINEAINQNDTDKYNGTEWRTHDDKYLFHTQKSSIDSDDLHEINLVEAEKTYNRSKNL